MNIDSQTVDRLSKNIPPLVLRTDSGPNYPVPTKIQKFRKWIDPGSIRYNFNVYESYDLYWIDPRSDLKLVCKLS